MFLPELFLLTYKALIPLVYICLATLILWFCVYLSTMLLLEYFKEMLLCFTMTRHFITTILVLVVVLFLNACYVNGNPSGREVISETESSNGQYQATIVRDNGGATVAFDYKVLIKHSNSETSFFREPIIFRSYSYPVPESISFTGPNTIKIICDDGSVFTVSFDKRTLRPDKKLKFYSGEPWR